MVYGFGVKALTLSHEYIACAYIRRKSNATSIFKKQPPLTPHARTNNRPAFPNMWVYLLPVLLSISWNVMAIKALIWQIRIMQKIYNIDD